MRALYFLAFLSCWNLALSQFHPITRIWYISHSNGADHNSGDKNYPFKTLNRAVKAANSGDEILVMTDRYSGPGNCDVFITKSIHIRSVNGDSKQVIFKCDTGGVAVLQVNARNFSMTAISIQGSALTAIHIVKGTTNLHKVRLQGNVGKKGGGFRIGAGAELYLSSCTVEDNMATNGGAGYLEAGVKLVVKNSLFNENTAKESGGALYFEEGCSANFHGTKFFSNQAAGGSGGAIYAVGLNVSMVGVHFMTNLADGDQSVGGCVAILKTANVYLRNSEFSSCRARGNGGAWYVGGTSFIEYYSCTFQGNQAANGGAWALDSPSIVLKGKSNSFNVNWSYGKGGGLWLNGAHVETIQDRFVSNTAKQSGGSYCLENDAMLNSTAGYYGDGSSPLGGGISLSDSTLLMKGSTVSENAGHKSAGVYCKGSKMSFFRTFLKQNIGKNIVCENCSAYTENTFCSCNAC